MPLFVALALLLPAVSRAAAAPPASSAVEPAPAPATGGAPEPDERAAPRKVAVMEVVAKDERDKSLAESLPAVIAAEIAKRRDFATITGASVRSLLELQKQRQILGDPGASTSGLATAAAADFVVAAELSRVAGGLLLSLTLADVVKAAPLRTATARARSDAALVDAVPEAIAELLSAFPRPDGDPPPAPTATAPAPAPAPAAAPAPAPAAATAAHAPAPARGGGRTLGWVGLGLGAAAAAVGAVFYGGAWSRVDDPMMQPQADQLESEGQLGFGLLAGGVVVAGASTLLLLSADAPPPAGGAPVGFAGPVSAGLSW